MKTPPSKCPYCEAENNNFVRLNQTGDYSGIEIAVNRQGLLRTRTFTAQDITEIKYCPNCGKAFNKFNL